MCGKCEMNPLSIVLTGGIGSGKSVVAAYLRSRGVPVFDSDSEAKALYLDKSFLSDIESAIGICLHGPDGAFDKHALSSAVFSSQEKMAVVESMVHPAVLDAFSRWKSGAVGRWEGYAGLPPFVVMESAIALDKPVFKGVFDAAVLVEAPLEARLRRVAERDGMSADDIRKRVAVQNTECSRADAVIINDSDTGTLYRRTDAAFESLRPRLADI